MKIMNITKLSLLLAVALLSSFPTFAQGDGQGRGQGEGRGQGQGQGQGQGRQQMTEEMVTERVARLQKNLELSDEQHKTILAFEIKKFKEGKVERQKFQGDREAMRTYMMAQREERDAKYKEVLTEEQYKKFKEQQQSKRSQRQGQGSDNSGDRPSRGRNR